MKICLNFSFLLYTMAVWFWKIVTQFSEQHPIKFFDFYCLSSQYSFLLLSLLVVSSMSKEVDINQSSFLLEVATELLNIYIPRNSENSKDLTFQIICYFFVFSLSKCKLTNIYIIWWQPIYILQRKIIRYFEAPFETLVFLKR